MFNGFFSRCDFPKIAKNGTYIINFDKYVHTGLHWVDFSVWNDAATNFNSFCVENILK